MDQNQLNEEIQNLNMNIYHNYAKLKELKSQKDPQAVADYEFLSETGEKIKLSDMFQNHSTLIVIHNMGSSCSWCTAWADGFSGIYPLVVEHTSFYVVSPESPDQQAKIKADRNWQFPMVSAKDTDFNKDMGFQTEEGYLPGLSVFTKEDTQIYRIDSAPFGPSDNFGVLWHLYDLLPENPMEG